MPNLAWWLLFLGELNYARARVCISQLPSKSKMHVLYMSSRIRIIFLDRPSVCWWYAILIRKSVPRALCGLLQIFDVNRRSLSEMIDADTPCNLTISFVYNLLNFSILLSDILIGRKWADLVSQLVIASFNWVDLLLSFLSLFYRREIVRLMRLLKLLGCKIKIVLAVARSMWISNSQGSTSMVKTEEGFVNVGMMVDGGF